MPAAGYPIVVYAAGGMARLAGVAYFPDPDAQPGAHWFNGGGAPSDSYGADGDYYLDVDTGNVWRKDGGTWA